MNTSATVSERIGKVPFSGIREIFEQAKRLEESGASITHMEIGRPDFDTPARIKAAAIEALESGQVHYSSDHGMAVKRVHPPGLLDGLRGHRGRGRTDAGRVGRVTGIATLRISGCPVKGTTRDLRREEWR